MVSVITVFFLALPTYYIVTALVALRRNIALAKKIGLNYVIIPTYQFNLLWMAIGSPLLNKFVERLPENSRWKVELAPMQSAFDWKYGYKVYERFGDTFITVSPGGIQIWTADRQVIGQITARRDDFPKPLWMYKSVNLFGRNVVTTEGTEWKFHRKITSPSFGERNNFLVFEETIKQGEQMLRKWAGADGKGGTVKDVLDDTMRLSLYVISKAGFGVGSKWPGESDEDTIGSSTAQAASHHKMPFKDALAGLLHNLLYILLIPKSLLSYLPFKSAKLAKDSYYEYTEYMKELFAEKRIEAVAGEKGEGMDIMGALVKNSYGPETRLQTDKTSSSDLERQKLTDIEILGNAFVFMLAGHETSAGAIHYGLSFLALHPASQRHLQADIDTIFGSKPPSEWDYNRDIAAMSTSMLGACMNEELRVVPPVLHIPKMVTPDFDQSILVDGKRMIWPKGTTIHLSALGVQRNPKYWPSLGPSKVTGADNDLDDFVPERWLQSGSSNPNSAEYDEKDGKDPNQANFFHPMKSSFIAFSDGARSCLGKRFAQVELMALLALIFQKYSVELDVTELASDSQVDQMNEQERKDLYDRQRLIARRTIKEQSSTRITIQIRNAYVPIRLVLRGKERFVNVVDT